ncbi:hypothetical protein PsorP6_010671 [Peronosclerospora sorghi]|uniref:Uncharacterized protein n=1 Tax=Peronosclerospora sorghi TaxID=230839 RepID=A0ACC0VVF4_9STRA|nr:hypothetical protein PsorP6_010671 [Peronosclerospora sorghi]
MRPFRDASSLELIERVSRWSRSHQEEPVDLKWERDASPTAVVSTPASTFNALDSPRKNGALDKPSPSPACILWDRRYFGLVLHSAAVGLVSTALPQCVYPFLTCYLNMQGTQTLSARTVLGLPWALKPLVALCIRCVPCPLGFRCRAAMHLGWLVTAAALIASSFQDEPRPYYQDRSLLTIPVTQLTPDKMTRVNVDAPSHGAFYVMMMAVAALGYVVADVAADEVVSGLRPSDGLSETVEATMTTARVFATLTSFLFLGIGMSGSDYGGEFDFTLEYTQVMLGMGLVAVLPVLLISCTTSEAPRPRRAFTTSVRDMWTVLSNWAFQNVLLCQFLGGVLAGASATAVNPMALYYAGVQPLNDAVVSIVAILAVLGMLKCVSHKGWTVNYRHVLVLSTIVVLLCDVGTIMFTIWDIVRSQWFWIGLPVMDAIPSAFEYTITTVLVTEVTDPKAATTISEVVLSVSSIAASLGLVFSKLIDAPFDVRNEDIQSDTTHVRTHIMLTFLLAYAMRLLSLVWLWGLPRNASEAQAVQTCRRASGARAKLIVVVLALSFVVVVVVHALSVTASFAPIVAPVAQAMLAPTSMGLDSALHLPYAYFSTQIVTPGRDTNFSPLDVKNLIDLVVNKKPRMGRDRNYLERGPCH